MVFTALVGDLGGTNVRLRLLSITAPELHNVGTVIYEKKYPSRTHPLIETFLLRFLEDAQQELAGVAGVSSPNICVLCVAGPCAKEYCPSLGLTYVTVQTTALSWKIDSRKVANALHIPLPSVHIMNDFEGVGYGVLGLPSSQIVPMNGTQPTLQAPIAVIGPGTGLGAAFLVHYDNEYHVCASEGGHMAYSPINDLELGLVKYIRREIRSDHVSFERVASGNGMRSVYRYVKHIRDPTNPLYIPENVHVYAKRPPVADCPVLADIHPAKVICELAMINDAPAVATLDLFAKALGRIGGNIATMTLPFGGLYVAGGMGAKLGFLLNPIDKSCPYVDTNAFTAEVFSKGRVSHIVDRVPLRLVLGDDVGLLGCAVIASRMATRISRDSHASL